MRKLQWDRASRQSKLTSGVPGCRVLPSVLYWRQRRLLFDAFEHHSPGCRQVQHADRWESAPIESVLSEYMLSSLGRSVRLDPSLHLRHHYFRYEAIPYDPHRLPGDVGRAGPVGPCARLAPDFHWVWHPRRRQIWILRGIQEVSTETAHKQKSSCCSHLLVVFDLAHTHYYVRSLSIACQIPLHCIALHYQAQHVSPHSLHCTTRHNTFHHTVSCRATGSTARSQGPTR